MKITASYTVNCSHEAFRLAMEKHMPTVKFHEVSWRDTENVGDDNDPDFFSTFSFPNKRYPELTKDLFWKMATHCLSASNHPFTALYIRFEGEKNAISITDGWQKGREEDGAGPRLRFDEKAFSSEMADRLKQIAALACGHEPGDW